MRVFLYYFYYRLYQWSQKRDASTSLFTTIVWLTVTVFFNLFTLASLISICTGIDPNNLLFFPETRYAGGLWMLIFGIFIWLFLKFFRVHQKAFSDEMKKRYEEVGCKAWWVITYFVVRMLA